MICGAIFDADGTLLDSMGMWQNATSRYLLSRHITPPPDLYKTLFDLSLTEGAEYVRRLYHLPDSPETIVEDINQSILRFYQEEVTAKPGAVSFLTSLRERGIPCWLATNTARSPILAGLQRTGLLPLLDGVLTCGELETNKREPLIFHTALDRLGTPLAETWVFEDASHAALTAHRAGFPVAGVFDPYGDQEGLKQVCRVFLQDLTEFEAFYEKTKNP